MTRKKKQNKDRVKSILDQLNIPGESRKLLSWFTVQRNYPNELVALLDAAFYVISIYRKEQVEKAKGETANDTQGLQAQPKGDSETNEASVSSGEQEQADVPSVRDGSEESDDNVGPVE